MDHSAHHHMSSASEDMGMDMCSMNMLFTWNTKNLCIVFRWWHVRNTLGLVVSLLAVVAFSAGYEALREGTRRYEAKVAARTEIAPRQAQAAVNKRSHLIKAALYGIQNFYAFMIMLIFMTYNGWVMISVSIGAFLGYLFFGGSTPVTKETACH